MDGELIETLVLPPAGKNAPINYDTDEQSDEDEEEGRMNTDDDDVVVVDVVPPPMPGNVDQFALGFRKTRAKQVVARANGLWTGGEGWSLLAVALRVVTSMIVALIAHRFSWWQSDTPLLHIYTYGWESGLSI